MVFNEVVMVSCMFIIDVLVLFAGALFVKGVVIVQKK